MNLTRSLYFISTFVVVAKSSAEADNGSVLAQSLSESKHIVRGSGSGSNDEKETENKDETSSVNQIPKRMLEAGTKRLLQLIPINIPILIGQHLRMSMSCDDCDDDKIFTASDGCDDDYFGRSCSMSDELVVIGAPWADDYTGAAYLFHLDGTEVAKLTPGDDGEDYDYNNFGDSVSMDEKIVVGTGYGIDYVRVFSSEGIYERTIRCNDCSEFGNFVVTHGNKIVIDGRQNSIWKLFIYSTEDGQLLKVIEENEAVKDVAISEQFIVATGLYKTVIYNNTSPDFPYIAEIEQAGNNVAVLDDRIVFGDWTANNYDGVAYLYESDGTLVTALDRQGSPSRSEFGDSVAITDDKVLVGAPGANNPGSVFIYSAVTGEFIKEVVATDDNYDHFGDSVCASASYYMVGAPGVNCQTGAAYLFQFSEE